MGTGVEDNADSKRQLASQWILWQFKNIHIPTKDKTAAITQRQNPKKHHNTTDYTGKDSFFMTTNRFFTPKNRLFNAKNNKADKIAITKEANKP